MSSRRDDTRAPSVRLVETVRRDIASGELAAGAKLPSVKDFARDHEMSTATAQNALRVLQGEGLIYSVPGRGNFVSADAEVLVEQRRSEPESEDYRAILARLGQMSETLGALEARLTDLERVVKTERTADRP